MIRNNALFTISINNALRVLTLYCLILGASTAKSLYLAPSTVKIIYTAALLDFKFEERKEEYLHSLTILKYFGYNPYILEACTPGPSFFDSHIDHIYYPNINIPTLRNKGVNELRLLLAGCKLLPFLDDDMIIKITGRYYFNNNDFLQFVENNQISFDAIAKKDSTGQVFTGCFALRYRYLKEFLSQLDLITMENKMINIETAMKKYLQQLEARGGKIKYIENIGLTANIFGDGQTMLTYW